MKRKAGRSSQVVADFTFTIAAGDPPEVPVWVRLKDHTIVRVHARPGSWFDPSCRPVGILLRETPKFYIYSREENRSHPLFVERRVRKERVHIVPCQHCPDHPRYKRDFSRAVIGDRAIAAASRLDHGNDKKR